MSTRYPAPRGFEEWLTRLHEHDIGVCFDFDCAAWMRVVANTKTNGIFFVSGGESIPYTDWLIDGMPMTNRLILHQDRRPDLMDALTQHYTTDIRIAVHYQALADFLSDIAHHRFDFVVVDLREAVMEVVSTLGSMLADNGLLVSIGPKSPQQSLIQSLAQTCFYAQPRPDDRDQCLVFTRKPAQHLSVRRGGRRRRAT